MINLKPFIKSLKLTWLRRIYVNVDAPWIKLAISNTGARNKLLFMGPQWAVMLLERGIRDISRVLVLARNSVYSARLVEDAIPHVYKMEGHRSFRQNPLILSS